MKGKGLMAGVRQKFSELIFKKTILSVLLFACVCVIASGTPSSVRAQVIPPGSTVIDAAANASMTGANVAKEQTLLDRIKNWAEQITAFKFIIDIFVGFNDMFSEFTKNFINKTGIKDAAEHAGVVIKSAVDKIIYEDKIKTTLAVKESQLAAAAAEKAASGNGGSVLCNTIVAHQGPAILYEFALAVENALTSTLMNMYRPDGGTGPLYVANSRAMDCHPTTGPRKNDLNSSNKRDNPPAKCLETDEKGAPNDDVEDIDTTSPGALAGAPGPDLALPPIVDVQRTATDGTVTTYKAPMPDDSLLANDESGLGAETFVAQQNFIAAMKFCIHAMGPRPAPPSGKAMMTPQGLLMTAQWNRCASMQVLFVRQCARMVAKHTQPNCAGKMSAICGEAILACEAAVALGADLPFSCTQPPSLYRIELASHMACFGRERLLGGTGEGTKPTETVQGSNTCAVGLAKWKTLQAKEDVDFLIGLKAMRKLRNCWPTGTVAPSIGQPTAPWSAPPPPTPEPEPTWEPETPVPTDLPPSPLGQPPSPDNGGYLPPGGEGNPDNLARAAAQDLLGVPTAGADKGQGGYMADDPNIGIDCRANYCLYNRYMGVDMPMYSSAEYYRLAANNEQGFSLVSLDQLRPGDGVAMAKGYDQNGNPVISHIAPYVGKGNEDILGQGNDMLNSKGSYGGEVKGASLENYQAGNNFSLFYGIRYNGK